MSVGGGEHPQWSPDGKTIYYRGPGHLMAARIAEQPQLTVTRRDTLFVDTYARSPHNEFSVFPNGRELLMVKRAAEKTELFMVVNWQRLIGVAGVEAAREGVAP